MTISYSAVTEAPGSRVTPTQLSMLHTRYVTAYKYCHDKDVLEVGCGPGLGLGYLANCARTVIGGDYTISLVQAAQNHYGGRVGLLCLDAQVLPFRDHCFDVIILYEAIYYLPQPDLFLKECLRLLRNDGLLLLCCANQDCPEFVGSRFGVQYFSVPDLSDMLEKHGFDVELYGAFPLGQMSLKGKLISGIRRVASAASLIPGSLKGRELLKRVFYGKLLVLEKEITGEKTLTEPLVPIPKDFPDRDYKVLYAVARGP